jgi:hypothetical protein
MGFDDGAQSGITPVHKLGGLQLITICIIRIILFPFRIFYIFS